MSSRQVMIGHSCGSSTMIMTPRVITGEDVKMDCPGVCQKPGVWRVLGVFLEGEEVKS